MAEKLKTAVFGGGCFWCTEAVFKRLRGVKTVSPGYAGGEMADPDYEDVSSGKTGHAEVIKIDFDPAEISFEDLLTVFFFEHDPTTLNRQGADVGTQYRSVILYTDEEQKNEALHFIEELKKNKAYEAPIVTEIVPLNKFYSAEDYHKDYYDRNKSAGYCEFVITPKVEKLEKKFAKLLNYKV
jgi:peptide-methionine (S)-S-oxide reductase